MCYDDTKMDDGSWFHPSFTYVSRGTGAGGDVGLKVARV